MGELSGWAWRKPITVNHTDDGQQENYQMKLTINHGDGVDAIGTVYLNHHALNWPIDIQITESDGTTTTPFYRREYDATDGTFWIKCDEITAGGTWTGYLYYGDVDASDASSLVNTFGEGKADDFEWGLDEDNISDDGGNIDWTIALTGGSTCKIDTAQAWHGTRSMRSTVAGGGAVDARCPKTVGSDYAVNFMLYKSDAVNFAFGHGNGTHLALVYAEPDEDITYYGATLLDSGSNATAATWQEYEFSDFNHATPKYDIWFNGSKIVNDASMLDNASCPNQLYFLANLANDTHWIDSLIVRKWTANEPTWAASGAEEALGTVIKSVPRMARIMLMG